MARGAAGAWPVRAWCPHIANGLRQARSIDTSTHAIGSGSRYLPTEAGNRRRQFDKTELAWTETLEIQAGGPFQATSRILELELEQLDAEI